MRQSHGIRSMAIVTGLSLMAFGFGGCASKKFVRQGIATQDTKINDLGGQVEENQKRIAETGERLDGVAADARNAESIGRQANSRADQAYGLAKGKLLYTVVLSEKAGNFGFDSSELNDATRKALDDFAARLKAENANVYLEIEGHTDGTGPEEYNMKLGEKRADVVRRYLNQTHGIPLHRIAIISYGATKPVADNHTRDGRAQNRRVEVRVLS